MPTYSCAQCNRDIHSYYELTPSPNLLCYNCYVERYGDKRRTKAILYKQQRNRCIVSGCPYRPKKRGGRGFHLHRIIPGKAGGKYEPSNCVLVCIHHHKTIEGLTLEEIQQLNCTSGQITEMDKYHIARTLIDYDWKDIEKGINKLCDELGVPAKCDSYDIFNAVRQELNL